MNITINDLLSVSYEKVINLDAIRNTKITGISTDSRTIKKGEIFVAIKGDNFDGNKFVNDAFKKGAACSIISKNQRHSSYTDKTYFIVKDTLKVLGELAKIYRSKFEIPIIAVSGSNGKTTTKEMIYSVLNTKYSVLRTQGNLNNQIGVPQTLFRLNKNHDVAVIEIGTNHFGEVGYLCDITKPTHGLITNIGHEHLEFFKDIKGVAKAEGELFKNLDKTATGIINADDENIVKQSKELKKKVTFGFFKNNVDVQGKIVELNSKGCAKFSIKHRNKIVVDVQLSTPGTHTMFNALAAATVGFLFNVESNEIREALENFHGIDKRMEIKKAGGVVILNDTYNANPDSMLSAFNTLKSMKCSGKKVVILTDMLELGTASEKEHRKIGKALNEKELEYLLTFGSMAKIIYEQANIKMKYHFTGKNKLSKYALTILSKGDIVLVKGSRGMKMEEVVNYLIGNLG